MTNSSSSDDDSSLQSKRNRRYVPLNDEEHEYYEYLGYPTVLYRNRDCYSFRDVLLTNPAEDFTTAEEFCDQQAHLSRCFARWYYPTDNVCRAIAVTPDFYPDATSLLTGLPTKKKKVKVGKEGSHHNEVVIGKLNEADEDKATDGDQRLQQRAGKELQAEKETRNDDCSQSNFVYAKRVPVYPRTARQKQMRKRRLESIFCSTDQSKYPEDTYLEVEALCDDDTPATFPLQDVVRANMLRAAAEQMQPSWELDRLKLHTIQTLDANYGQWPTSKAVDPQTLLDLSAFYDRERMDYADPAYQAFFPLDLAKSSLRGFTKAGTPERRLCRIKETDHYAPHLFGNCIFVGHCGCAACDGTKFPVFYILHPVGPLLDRVRLSFLHFPKGDSIDEFIREDPAELQLDDRLLQIVRCGDNPSWFVARTFIDISVFAVTFIKPKRTQRKEGCWLNAKLTTIHRINHVTFRRHEFSFRPRWTTAYPEFGSNFTPSRIATVYNCSNGESNFIRTLSAGASTYSEEDYTIKNLKEITDIEYHSHPMLLWAAGRSYARPALEPHHIQSSSKPLLGLGSALYTVDLRDSEKAVFQWSPSAEAYLVEGIQSVSGIAKDPYHEYRLWVSSINSQRTWELDCRMPCRSLCSYSLPFLADVPPKLVDKNDVIGSGMLFCFPQMKSAGTDTIGTHLPILGISKRPQAYGIHCYHRYTRRSTFQKRPTEVFAGPLFPTTKASLVKSSSFGLPEISDAIFHCGLAAFESVVEQYLNPNALPLNVEPHDRVLSTISMTNKGDLYCHTMLRSTSPDRRGAECPRGVWVGSSIVELPEDSMLDSAENPSDSNMLPLTVSNHEPQTSKSIDIEKTGFINRSLDPFELRGRTMGLRGQSRRDRYEQQLNRCFPPVDAFADSEFGTLEDTEDLDCPAGEAPIELGKRSKSDTAIMSSVVLRQSGVLSSTSYGDCFDVCTSVLETGEEKPRSDLTRATLESMWSEDSDCAEG